MKKHHSVGNNKNGADEYQNCDWREKMYWDDGECCPIRIGEDADDLQFIVILVDNVFGR